MFRGHLVAQLANNRVSPNTDQCNAFIIAQCRSKSTHDDNAWPNNVHPDNSQPDITKQCFGILAAYYRAMNFAGYWPGEHY